LEKATSSGAASVLGTQNPAFVPHGEAGLSVGRKSHADDERLTLLLDLCLLPVSTLVVRVQDFTECAGCQQTIAHLSDGVEVTALDANGGGGQGGRCAGCKGER